MTPDERIAALTRLVADLSARVSKLEKKRKKHDAVDDVCAPGIRNAIEGVAIKRGVTVAGLIGGETKRTVSRARSAAYLACRREGFSAHEIGRFFGRDHSTVLKCAAKAEAMEKKSPDQLNGRG